MQDTRRFTDNALLTELVRFWQGELALRDWHIVAAIKPRLEMGKENNADVAVTENRSCAFIRLIHPADSDPTEMEPYDMEIALVHEMLHVRLYPFLGYAAGSVRDVAQEQTVHQTSVTLVRKERELREMRTRLARKRKSSHVVH